MSIGQGTLDGCDIPDKSTRSGTLSSDVAPALVGKTPEERKALARHYFDIQKASLTPAFASAPAILFVTAAGNSNNDASFIESVPSGIVLPKLLTVGAVDSAGDAGGLTRFVAKRRPTPGPPGAGRRFSPSMSVFPH